MKSIGKLGFFDSGIGWLEVMREFQALYPDMDMVYFGDRANCPYGNRPLEQIIELTAAGVDYLVQQGCVIIILACNTAVAQAVRYLQNEKYPPGSGIKTLWVTLPGAEKVVSIGIRKVAVLATSATVASRAYADRVGLLDRSIQVQEIAIPGLVDLIESEPRDARAIELALRPVIERFDADNEALVLWCTHFPIVRPEIERIWNEIHGITPIVIDPGKEAAERFAAYLKKHPEFEIVRTKAKPFIFCTEPRRS